MKITRPLRPMAKRNKMSSKVPMARIDPVYSLHRSLGLLQASDDEQAGVEETILAENE
jgi:hypothetical protein